MSKITNDRLTRSGTGCVIAVPVWQQWASKAVKAPSRGHRLNKTDQPLWSWSWAHSEVFPSRLLTRPTRRLQMRCSCVERLSQWHGSHGFEAASTAVATVTEHHYHQSSVDCLIEQCLTSPPTQYRLSGRRFLQVKRPNQQYQSTEGKTLQK